MTNTKNTMSTYIHQEYEVCRSILANWEENLAAMKAIVAAEKPEKWLILATGSSLNSAQCAKYYLEKTAGITVDLREPYNFSLYDKMPADCGLIMAVSQRGTSYSTIEAMKRCKNDSDAKRIILTSVLNSPLTAHGDCVVDMGCGVETVGYSTKGVSATILTMFTMGVMAAEALGRLTHAQAQAEIAKLQAAVEHIPAVVAASEAFYAANKADLDSGARFAPIGYGPNVGTVKEAETKFTETVACPTQGFELEAYMHGPIYELHRDYTLIFTDVPGTLPYERSVKFNQYLRKYCDRVYTITTGANTEDPRQLGLGVTVDELISPLLLVIPYQMLSYLISCGKGHDLEDPYPDFKEVMGSKVE